MAKKPYKRSAYAEKLLDPRWQRKRLEVLKRDEFCCQHCGDTEATLHVHHTYYQYGNDPWEYPDDSLVTYCEECHTHAGRVREELREVLTHLSLESQIYLQYALGYLVNLNPSVASNLLCEVGDLSMETAKEEASKGTYKAQLAIRAV